MANSLKLCYLTFSFGLGLLPYFYTYRAALKPTRGSWGDTATSVGFFRHLFRTEYGTLKLSPRDTLTEVGKKFLNGAHLSQRKGSSFSNSSLRS